MTSRHTRAAIVAACRRMMQAGRLRPTMRAARAGWSRSTGHWTFGSVVALHRAAIDDIATQHAILGAERGALGLNAGRRMVKSVVLGRRLAEIETLVPEAWAVDAPADRSAP